MKKSLFIFILAAAPLLVFGQNYILDINPRPNGKFAVQQIDDSRETFPRQEINHGTLDTAALQLLTYQLIEQARAQEANFGALKFYAQLKADQTRDTAAAVIVIDYNAWAAARWATAFEGQYTYFARDGNAIPAHITGLELRRNSNNNLLLTLVPQAANFLIATTAGANPVTFNLYQSGDFWVGRKATGAIVTLKRL